MFSQARRYAAPLLCVSMLALSACGSTTPAPEPVLLSQFNKKTDRFAVISTVGKADGTIQKDGRACDIYKIYTTGLTSGGRAALKAGEVLTSVATLGVAQIIWAPVKAGTRPQQHTVLFCFANNDKLVDIYDKDPTDSTGPDHLIINRAAYQAAIANPVALPQVPAAPAVAPVPSAATTPTAVPEPTAAIDGSAPVIATTAVAPKAAADAGTISLNSMAQEATNGYAQIKTAPVKVDTNASADDLNAISDQKAKIANKPALSTSSCSQNGAIAPNAAATGETLACVGHLWRPVSQVSGNVDPSGSTHAG